MILQISHVIQYSYSTPVFLEPHVFRLRPRNDPSLQIKNFSLSITPQPVGLHEFLDAEGNLTTCAWFEDLIDSLSISTVSEIKTIPINPFDYLVTESRFLHLPAVYSSNDTAALAPCLGGDGHDDLVKSFAAPIIKKSGGETIPFLSLLNMTIYEEFKVENREQGEPLPPAVLLQKKQGACRDLAVLFMACCRSAGIAARFVSGYHQGDEKAETRDLHAWAEVYMPGCGWKGYDPTLGLAVTEQHVPLAASWRTAGAAPVAGNYRGTGVSSTIDFKIDIRRM